jgi:hypothetical protein
MAVFGFDSQTGFARLNALSRDLQYFKRHLIGQQNTAYTICEILMPVEYREGLQGQTHAEYVASSLYVARSLRSDY